VTTIEVERAICILLSHIYNRLMHQYICVVMWLHSWSHVGCVELVNQAAESTLQDGYSAEQEYDEVSTLNTAMEGF
jgi:hypothetical protein